MKQLETGWSQKVMEFVEERGSTPAGVSIRRSRSRASQASPARTAVQQAAAAIAAEAGGSWHTFALSGQTGSLMYM